MYFVPQGWGTHPLVNFPIWSFFANHMPELNVTREKSGRNQGKTREFRFSKSVGTLLLTPSCCLTIHDLNFRSENQICPPLVRSGGTLCVNAITRSSSELAVIV